MRGRTRLDKLPLLCAGRRPVRLSSLVYWLDDLDPMTDPKAKPDLPFPPRLGRWWRVAACCLVAFFAVEQPLATAEFAIEALIAPGGCPSTEAEDEDEETGKLAPSSHASQRGARRRHPSQTRARPPRLAPSPALHALLTRRAAPAPANAKQNGIGFPLRC